LAETAEKNTQGKRAEDTKKREKSSPTGVESS